MVAQGGIYRNFLVAPNNRLAVPDLPVVFVVTVVDNIAREANKGRIDIGNSLHQGDAHGRICGLGICGIVEPRISISYESKRSLHIEPYVDGDCLCTCFPAACQCEQRRSREK